jgi:type IV secretory pathway VirD2 relaxase
MLLDDVSSGLWEEDDAVLASSDVSRPLIVTDESPRKSVFKKLRRHAGAEAKNKGVGTRLKMRDGVVRGNSFAGSFSGQRVVVKINPVQNRTKGVGAGAGSGAKNLYQHVRYISRSGAGKEETQAVLFDRENDGVDGLAFYGLCKNDRHHFRMIISPENGHQIDDFHGYVRGVMGQMESDLGTTLNWIGAVHYDTDDVHAHVIIRGVNERGQDLVIGRDYIASGVRARAQELATELLGERSLEEIQKSQEKQVEALSVTSLDRFIEKNLNDERAVDVRKENNFGKDRFYEGLVKGRLQFLSTTGLATEYPPGIYTLRENYMDVLRESSQRQNVLNNLYRQNPDVDLEGLSFYSMKADESEVIHGLVINKGPVDEITDRKYLVVKDAHETLHYVPFGELKDYDDLRVGALVTVKPGVGSSGKADFNISQMAKANNGIYDPRHHMAYIEAELSHIEAENREGYLDSHAKRLETLTKNGIVKPLDDGRYEVPADIVERGEEITREINTREGKRFYPKLEVLSARPLEKLVSAEKRTWLDRELYKQSIGKPSMSEYGAEVEVALQGRREWLVSKDLAVIQSNGEFALRDGAMKQLRIMEMRRVGEKLAGQLEAHYTDKLVTPDKPYTYRGYAELESGTWAVVQEKDSLHMARVQSVPDTSAGKAVAFSEIKDGVVEMRELQVQQRASKVQELSQAERTRREPLRDEDQELER